MSHSASLESTSADAATAPAYISPYGIRAQRYKEMILCSLTEEGIC